VSDPAWIYCSYEGGYFPRTEFRTAQIWGLIHAENVKVIHTAHGDETEPSSLPDLPLSLPLPASFEIPGRFR
jgi:hypothetical protein